jgi:uncharacterized protein YcfL
MKKVVYTLAVLFSVAMVSCGSKQAEAVDSDSVVADTVVETVDTAAVDSNAVVADSAAAPVEAAAPVAE